LRTAAKPDSQDVCFITSTGGRTAFLGSRIPFRRATVVDAVDGEVLAEADSLEMITLGQRRGIGLPGGGPKRYVVDIDHASATVRVGDESMLSVESMRVEQMTWAHEPVSGEVCVQCSAHGATQAGVVTAAAGDARSVDVRWLDPQRRVAPGQSVVFYDPSDTFVLGGGIAR
jgi:tRNA-specific 2-thiouridylase